MRTINSYTQILCMSWLVNTLLRIKPIQYTDIWASSDQGVSWSMITTKFPWSSYSTFDQTVEITKDGIIITSVSALNGNFHSEVWSSLDGGLTWGICNRAAEYGARKAPGVAWNVHGHMYVVAGYTLPGIEVYAFDVWKSDISFHNITSVAHACDFITTVRRCWTTQVAAAWRLIFTSSNFII